MRGSPLDVEVDAAVRKSLGDSDWGAPRTWKVEVEAMQLIAFLHF